MMAARVGRAWDLARPVRSAPRRWASLDATSELDAQTLQQAEAALARNPELADTLVEHPSPEIRQRLMMAAVRADTSGAAAVAFREADVNNDGKLSPDEFQRWVGAVASASPKAAGPCGRSGTARCPTSRGGASRGCQRAG